MIDWLVDYKKNYWFIDVCVWINRLCKDKGRWKDDEGRWRYLPGRWNDWLIDCVRMMKEKMKAMEIPPWKMKWLINWLCKDDEGEDESDGDTSLEDEMID